MNGTSSGACSWHIGISWFTLHKLMVFSASFSLHLGHQDPLPKLSGTLQIAEEIAKAKLESPAAGKWFCAYSVQRYVL